MELVAGGVLPFPSPHEQNVLASTGNPELQVVQALDPVAEVAFPSSHVKQVSEVVADGVEL